MPPENQSVTSDEGKSPVDPKDHLLSAHNPRASGSSGPIVGIIIIVALLLVGGWYFWVSREKTPAIPLPLIPADDSTSQQQ